MLERLKDNPVIAAVRSAGDMKTALDSEVTTVFLLNCDIFNLKQMVDEIKNRSKSAFVHIDFVEGLAGDNKAVDYITEIIKPAGIISTKGNLLRHAKGRGIFTIQRFFLIDSLSYHTMIKQVQSVRPDMIEVLPGVMPGVINRICMQVSMPVIAGGLIETKQDMIEILKAGAIGASTSKVGLWDI